MIEGEFEPERHLVAHEADGRDEQAGPAGPAFHIFIYFIQLFMTMTKTMTKTMAKTMTKANQGKR